MSLLARHAFRRVYHRVGSQTNCPSRRHLTLTRTLPNPRGYEVSEVKKVLHENPSVYEVNRVSCPKTYHEHAEVVFESQQTVTVEVTYTHISMIGSLDSHSYPSIVKRYSVQRDQIKEIMIPPSGDQS